MLETDPIVDAVCAKLQSRSAVGIKKYGTTLAGNYATAKEKLIHIQEELLDGANYIEWLLEGEEMPTPMTIEMEANERQAALASLKREYELNGSNPYNWFIRDYYDILCAALQSPHPYYGPCDALANGDCAECLKQSPRVTVIEGLDEAIAYTEGSLQATLQHARMIVKNHDAFPNTPLFLKLQAEETIKNSEMGLKLIEGARAYAELQKGV